MKIKLLILIVLTICVLGCNINKEKKDVLIMGKYKLTKADLEFKRKQDRYKSLTEQAFADKLIKEGRIIAFALDHRYDTLATLKKLFEYASRSYAAQVDGFVWNKKVKPKLQLTEADIKNTYFKRSKEYVVEVVLFSDKSVLNRYYKPSEDFNLIKAKASSDLKVKVFNAPVKFPYYPLSYYTEGLNNLEVGKSTGPVETENGYLIAHVAAIKPVVQNTYEQEKANIRRDLLFGLTQKYLWEIRKRILNQADPEMNDLAIKEITAKFDARKRDWPQSEPDLLLMKYSFEGKRKSYLLSDFKEYVNNAPVIFGSLAKPEDVKKILQSIIIEYYQFAEAKQMNIEVDEDYLRSRKDNQEKIFIEQYKRNYIYPKLSVNSEELEDYYLKNRRNFRTFKSASISLYKFKNMQNAFKGRAELEQKIRGIYHPLGNSNKANAALLLPNAIEMEVKIDDQDNDPKLLGTVLRLAPGQISSPIEVKGEFLVIVIKAKKGVTTLPYIYVKDDVQRLIYAQKEMQLTARLAEGLKDKYPVEKNELKEYFLERKGNSQ